MRYACSKKYKVLNISMITPLGDFNAIYKQ